MKKIAFYISDHGFGHASRNIPIIRYILEERNDIRIYIKTGIKQGEFIKDSLMDLNRSNNVIFDLFNVDIGLVLKKNSLDIDVYKLNKKVTEYIDSWDDKRKKEKEFLIKNNINSVICDIVPWILKVTNELKIKSLLISNFTWVDIYEEYLNKEICNKFKECYELVDKTFLYDLYMDSMKKYITNYDEVGLICRKFNLEKVKEIKSKYKKPIVFVSIGRSVEVDKVIDVSSLNYNFIVTEGINLKGDNVTYLPVSTNNTHEYIKASDYVITKAGWGTVAECLIANKKIALLSRDGVAEDKNTIDKLVNRNLAIKIESNNLNIKDTLERLKKFSPSYDVNESDNCDQIIVNKILHMFN
ncbi:glycosyltransferase [Clostridium sp. Ade.TY]|uniref:glycosyltransferase n=1 Tax=Clostridium sp. Ade.TY TaxID=1391647 RepID=UPI0004128E35|nr:glycosyltransferase [Clostridium sp. Ade.TY]